MPFDGAFSPLHWLVIVVVAFLVLGPRELPEIGKKVGRVVRELRQLQHQLDDGAGRQTPDDSE